ncbi:cytochrome c3 family protein [Neobacillus sp. LXY-1]|uniref:cytochrome c3 family protein n=1 Tax=Neobacillus sp. LXY-1 TaxID=3379133 RepID=UPI003EE13186
MATENSTSEQKSKKKLFKKLSRKRLIFILLSVFVLLMLSGFGVIKASDNPAFCSTLCHNMEPMYDSYEHSNLLANAHKKKDVVCHDCHQDSLAKKSSEGVKYVTGDYEDPMKTREFSKSMCLKCHDYEKVKAKTNFKDSNPHDSHNGQLDCNKCHRMHEPSKVYCANCHEFSWMEKLPDSFSSKK